MSPPPSCNRDLSEVGTSSQSHKVSYISPLVPLCTALQGMVCSPLVVTSSTALQGLHYTPIRTSPTVSPRHTSTPSVCNTHCLTRCTPYIEWKTHSLPHKAYIHHTLNGNLTHCLTRHTPYPKWILHSLLHKAYITPQVGTALTLIREIFVVKKFLYSSKSRKIKHEIFSTYVLRN